MSNKKENIISIKSQEGGVFWFGVIMALLLLGVIGYYFLYDKKTAGALSLVFLAHAFGGRAAGIGLCIINEFSSFVTIAYNFYQEVLIVCFTYSLFVLSVKNYVKLRVVRFYALRLERKARVHKDKIERYGWIGLFLFVMAPLPVTGPVMGSIIGSLLRFRLLANFSATFLGTLSAIIVWTYFFDLLNQHLSIIRYIFAAIVAVILFSYLKNIKEWFNNRRS